MPNKNSSQQNSSQQNQAEEVLVNTYQSFLVRLWQEGKDSLWRGSAQSVQTGEIIRFANLTELFAFLDAQTAEESEEEKHVGWRTLQSSCPARISNS